MGSRRMPRSEPWRQRRERYLRESGREIDLIKEGYASAAPTPTWMVVIGGRTAARPRGNPRTRPFLVKDGPRVTARRAYERSAGNARYAP